MVALVLFPRMHCIIVLPGCKEVVPEASKFFGVEEGVLAFRNVFRYSAHGQGILTITSCKKSVDDVVVLEDKNALVDLGISCC
jgi:hypothetical protein